MNYNANVDGNLKVRGDRLTRKLEEVKQIVIEDNIALTNSELVEFISWLQKFTRKTLRYKKS